VRRGIGGKVLDRLGIQIGQTDLPLAENIGMRGKILLKSKANQQHNRYLSIYSNNFLTAAYQCRNLSGTAFKIYKAYLDY